MMKLMMGLMIESVELVIFMLIYVVSWVSFIVIVI